jgi:hypothetical protein
MTAQEFDNSFDVLYNNITSNQAPGLDSYEKSLFLTKAQDEIIKNYFLKQSNPKQAGFDDNQKRQADFSNMMKSLTFTQFDSTGSVSAVIGSTLETTASADDNTTYYRRVSNTSGIGYLKDSSYRYIETVPGSTPRSESLYTLKRLGSDGPGRYVSQPNAVCVSLNDSDVFIIVNERVQVTRVNNGTEQTVQLVVKPISYEEYDRLMQKPFKYPVHYQAWRLMTDTNKRLDIVVGPTDTVSKYSVRFIKRPKPIIVASLGDLTIDGYSYGTGANQASGCELDEILHQEILQRAVELAKVAWTANGQDNAQLVIQTGARSE